MEQNSQIVAPATDASEGDTGEQNQSGHEAEAGEFDPLGGLIDYMVANIDAEYALASFEDLYGIFGVAGIPDDIVAELEAIQPPIQVDESGVATIAVDMTRRLDGEESAESSARGDASGHQQVEDTSFE
ncbi:hypothetical protein LXA43DRAFT_1097854 [Ganoderma leucocontextum]|nr:hypothetical protein LXA43DRAFT_1097854 [Ganoderma leucocontextum]